MSSTYPNLRSADVTLLPSLVLRCCGTALILGCVSSFLLGCAAGAASTPASPVPIPPQTFVTSHAYGASITYGETLANPTKQAYPYLVAVDRSLTVTDYAIPGDQACDLPTRQIFPNSDSPALAAPPLYTMLVGTNDVDVEGTGPYEAIYNLCQQAIITWLGIPVEFKVLAGSPTGVTTSGGGAIDTTNNWNSWTTAAKGSSITFAITTTKAGPIYAWPRIDDNNPGTYSYSLDGAALGTGTTQTTPRLVTQNGSSNSLGLLRIPGVPAGKHTLTFTQTSAAANGFSIVGVGAPQTPTSGYLPTVLVGTITFQLPGNPNFLCSKNDAPCQQYNLDIAANVNLLAGDGLNVRLFDTRKFMFGTAAEMNDTLHPNAFGQVELSHAVESVF